MFDSIQFVEVPGSKNMGTLRILALSSCGFCQRAMDFLKERDIAFSYVHLDQYESDVKTGIKEEFKQKFKSNLSYPALVVDDDKYTIGFIRRYWLELLGLTDDEVETLE